MVLTNNFMPFLCYWNDMAIYKKFGETVNLTNVLFLCCYRNVNSSVPFGVKWTTHCSQPVERVGAHKVMLFVKLRNKYLRHAKYF